MSDNVGICDKCQNSNVQPLYEHNDQDLCALCLEEEQDGRVAKQERDSRFVSDYKSIVRGVRT